MLCFPNKSKFFFVSLLMSFFSTCKLAWKLSKCKMFSDILFYFQLFKSDLCEEKKKKNLIFLLLLLTVDMDVPWVCPGMEVIPSSSPSVPCIIIKTLIFPFFFKTRSATRKVDFLQKLCSSAGFWLLQLVCISAAILKQWVTHSGLS